MITQVFHITDTAQRDDISSVATILRSGGLAGIPPVDAGQPLSPPAARTPVPQSGTPPIPPA